jgi:hypothetical protein
MGDRANFGFRDSKEDVVFLYGHWAGYKMLDTLARAVDKARPRWNDETYATRIAISQIVGTDWEALTGWGITVNELADNEHKVPIIDWAQGLFTLYEEDLQTVVTSMPLDVFVTKYSQLESPAMV